MIPFQRNNNNKPKCNQKLTASINLVSTTKKLVTTVNFLNKSINLIGSRSRPQHKIQTDLKRHLSNLQKYGNCLTIDVIPSLTIGNISYAVSRYTNNEQNATQDHSVIIYPSLASPSKRTRLSPREISSNNLPFPVVGMQYYPEEAMKILANNTTQSVSKKIKLMIEKGYTPIKKTAIYKLLSEYKSSGKVYDEWHISGRRPIITITKFDQSIDKYFDNTGRSITTRDIDTILNTTKQKICGEGALLNNRISTPSKYKYRMLSSYSNERLVRKVCMQKNEQRYTAESSTLSSICYLFTIATTHYLVGPPDTTILRPHLSNLSKGAALFTKLVSRANNNLPVRPLLPGLIISTDDFTLFVLKGKDNKSDGRYLVQKKSTGKQGGKNQYIQTILMVRTTSIICV